MQRIQVYAGGSSSHVVTARLRELGWGQVYSEGPWRKIHTPQWVFDNGAWEAFVKGLPFPEAKFCRRVERCVSRGFTPDFIVLPDAVGDFWGTLALADGWAADLPAAWPKYLALQDGATSAAVADFLSRNDVTGLFLGGTDAFKNNTAASWVGFSKRHGLKFHYARAGTPRKFAHAMLLGSDSLDSSRLSRSQRDFDACKRLYLDGLPIRLIPEPAH